MLMIVVQILIIIQINLSVAAYKNRNTVLGRNVIVHLFEWKWNDIAAECERFLFFKGYGGVQISPPMEHAINTTTRFGPWFERYQPVSYNKFDSRSGTEMQLRNMIRRCNNVGVRIYVDAVINQMSEFSGIGSAGTLFNATAQYFPGVPYGPIHFNDMKCKTVSGSIESYQNAAQVRDCKIEKLPDLATADDFVRNKIAEYMNSLIDMGVAGFRIDNAKHIWPADLEAIYVKLNNLRPDIFGANKRPFIYQEVIDLGTEPIKSTDYTHLGRVTELKYGRDLSNCVARRNNQRMAYLRNFGVGWGQLPDNDSFVFVDNHDNQRGFGGGGSVLTYKQLRQYKIANAFMLAYPYGLTQVMSSYAFSSNTQGPPLDAFGNTNDVIINQNEECENGWICEHRLRPIYNMVEFRNVAGSTQLEHWWDDDWHQLAFARGNTGFIAINNDDVLMFNRKLQTGLQGGSYCDIISGEKLNNRCTGKTITVDAAGFVDVSIAATDNDPIIAIHINSKL